VVRFTWRGGSHAGKGRDLAVADSCGYASAISGSSALEAHPRRSWIGWVFAVVGGAFALAGLEVRGVLSRNTSDELGIVIVFYCMGLGALNAYTFRPKATERDRDLPATPR